MVTDTEALRAKFEAWFSGGFPRSVERNVDGEYKYMPADSAWRTYQAGHAAAKAETADVGEPAAWMAVVTHSRSQGPQAHFVSDAKLARQWDYNGVVDGEPCIVQPLFTAHQLAAAVAAAREKCAGIVNELRMECARRNMPESATMLWHAEDAIRAGAKEPSDG
ncbi:hypothetical protein FVQ98_10520 [Ottowia sp. GY511]|uniref:Uncharacterized protein n=1 Tax=Ottowia flava TaxID=2675430 RepID=A0ABW4KPL8_9BURK|nr:hypothetical protein [Ottowia sp. GY511]TXK27747.1 hypothetical protein FVQ98_10520 [Ottowia sp. GY511]